MGDHECPGCIGRGTGRTCSMCSGVIPVGKRRTKDSPSEVRQDCRDCQRGARHTH